VEIVVIQFVCALTLASISSYLGGRVHQRRRENDQRRTAFREGFRRASATVAALSIVGDQRTAQRPGHVPDRPVGEGVRRDRPPSTRRPPSGRTHGTTYGR
jgi:hypothetical protein